MNRQNRQWVTHALCALIVAVLLSSCSSTSVNRQEDGALVVNHRTLLIKTEAPSLEVERDGKNEYKAKFNAKSRGGDIAAMAEILKMFIEAMKVSVPAIPLPQENEDE